MAESSDEWELDPSEGTKRKITQEIADAKRQKAAQLAQRPKRVPVINTEISTWKATEEWSTQFEREVDCGRLRYREYVTRCLHLGQGAVRLNQFLFAGLLQSGWCLKDGKFTVARRI